MEKEDKDILQKIRSSRACIRDGYRMFTERFRRIFRHTWKWAIGFAVLSAVASALPVLVSPTLILAGLLIEVVAVVVFLWLANKQLHKRGFFEATQKVGFKAWMRHLGMLLLIMIVCLVIISILISSRYARLRDVALDRCLPDSGFPESLRVVDRPLPALSGKGFHCLTGERTRRIQSEINYEK